MLGIGYTRFNQRLAHPDAGGNRRREAIVPDLLHHGRSRRHGLLLLDACQVEVQGASHMLLDGQPVAVAGRREALVLARGDAHRQGSKGLAHARVLRYGPGFVKILCEVVGWIWEEVDMLLSKVLINISGCLKTGRRGVG